MSGSLFAASAKALKQLGVQCVLSCCERMPFASNRTENLLVRLRDIQQESLASHLPTAFEFLDRCEREGRRCLVHCMVGASRSVTLVLAFLVVKRGWALRAAFEHVRARRGKARPNRGFAEQLIALELETRGAASATLADFGY